MLATINPVDLKEQVSLVDLLARLGFQPLRRSGKELLYLSMLRDSDTRPSFAVNEQLNVWYDHGMGKGGNLIDFGQQYWNLGFRETLQKIQAVCGTDQVAANGEDRKPRRRHALKLPHYQVENVRDAGGNPAITAYLQSRHLWPMAAAYLREVYYYVLDEKKLRKDFFAAGWQNQSGGWEVRNKYFKGCLGHKAITLIPRSPQHLAVFEGYFDFLSWQVLSPEDMSSVLVLNTLSLIPAAIREAKDFPAVSLYFDRDAAGLQAAQVFTGAVPKAIDRSDLYRGYKDFNDLLIARPVTSAEDRNAETQLTGGRLSARR